MSTLVIGYGSPLRGDDAVGLHVAEAVHGRGLPGVEARALHQLAPELAVDVGEFDRVVFVDADVDATEVTVRAVAPSAGAARTTHHMRPEVVLALAEALGETVPRAFAVSVPARALGLSTELSAGASVHVREAVDLVVALCAAPTPEVAHSG